MYEDHRLWTVLVSDINQLAVFSFESRQNSKVMKLDRCERRLGN